METHRSHKLVNVVFTGRFHRGHGQVDVADSVARLFGLPVEMVENKFLPGQPSVLKTEIPADKAQRLVERLRALGAECAIVPVAKPVPPPKKTSKGKPWTRTGPAHYAMIVTACSAVVAVGILAYAVFFPGDRSARAPRWEKTIASAKSAVVTITVPGGQGSGFFVSEDGLIITNQHVVDAEDTVAVRTQDGREMKGEVLSAGIDPMDIALIKVSGAGYSHLDMASPGDCREGEEVVAIGSAKGMAATVTRGIVSSCRRTLSAIAYVQTDTPINPGNSGGPLINRKGEVVGVSTFKLMDRGVEGMNFALSAEAVRDFRENKVAHLVASQEERRLMRDAELDRLRNVAQTVYNKLQAQSGIEYARFSDRLNVLYQEGKLNYEEADALLRRIKRPPVGYESHEAWVTDLSRRVIVGDLTEDDAVRIIKGHYAI